jgi:large subunit ribosomal protein L5
MTDFEKDWKEHPMRGPLIEKVVVNIGIGSEGEKMEPAMKLLQKLTEKKPVQTYSRHKIPAWGLRQGLPIGTKVTLRGQDARDFLRRSLEAVDNTLTDKNFDDLGNLSFGIVQYVFYDGVKYDPSIGTMGLQVSATIERPGFRVKRRKMHKSKVGAHHLVPRGEAIAFITKEFGVKIENG